MTIPMCKPRHVRNISPGFLQSIGRQPRNPEGSLAVVEHLGWLAPWMLRDEVLEQAARLNPVYSYLRSRRLKPTLGASWTLFALKTRGLQEDNYLLEHYLLPAIVLPLIWREVEIPPGGSPDDSTLPLCLTEKADQVRKQLVPPKKSDSGMIRTWGLFFNMPSGEEGRSFKAFNKYGTHQELSMSAESAWGSLFTSLWLALKGIHSQPHIWCSAAYDPQAGVAAVGEVAAKVRTAALMGVKTLYLPILNITDYNAYRQKAQQEDVQVTSKIEVKYIDVVPEVRQDGKPIDGKDVMKPYFNELGVPPGSDARLEDKLHYYNLPELDDKRAIDYYWREIIDEVIEALRCKIYEEERLTSCENGFLDGLVIPVGNERNIVYMSLATFNPRVCVMIADMHDGGVKRTVLDVLNRVGVETTACAHHLLQPCVLNVQQTAPTLRLREVHVIPLPPARDWSYNVLKTLLASNIQKITQQFRPGCVVYDLTPAFKLISLVLSEFARPGDWLAYCRHQFLEHTRRIKAGTEVYELWPKNTNGYAKGATTW
ncbi:MAG: hypothetical protein KatS3mg114_0222 [Planctomycetaceae bacterium]|nr:MAG: hypothetical protein KatS3mg114_0222 [Planctomycetaceae bacterium]